MIVAAGVSNGIGISRAKLFKRDLINPVKNVDDAGAEADKLDYCINAAKKELKKFYDDLPDINEDIKKTIYKYINIINNRQLIGDIKDTIKGKHVSAEYAVAYILNNAKKQLESLDDEYLFEKAEDIEEIKWRLLNKLGNVNCKHKQCIAKECILVANDITPYDVLNIDPYYVKGIVTIYGGPTSSSSIIARHMNIPVVTGVGLEGMSIKDGDLLIVDGGRGKVIVNPDDRQLKQYNKEHNSSVLQ
ncbi:MAG: PEP-utilizing enzyme [Clostridiales bacterium]|nr:PEP-utilizing enzyme [Clostridiales bacterium]HBM80775.1 hypothetical protein [Clostridiaceae bacterium]